MESDIKAQLLETLQKKVVERRAMFIPLVCISAFGLVGYAAIDKEAPVIESNKVEVLYGQELTRNVFAVSDNRDTQEAIGVYFDSESFDSKQLGIYDVEVTAIDMFSNTSTKIVKVEVVDRIAPVISPVKKTSGYTIDVEINGSSDIKKYVKAVDNVDGNISSFIESNKKLDTSKLGTQTIEFKVSDNVGNTTSETYEFYVSDNTAPVISTSKVTVDYGSSFDYSKYVTIKDNFDKKIREVKVEGKVNTKEIGQTTIKVTATDSSGNSTSKDVAVTVADISAPKLTLTKSSVSVSKGKSINLESYIKSAVDNKDGNLKKSVKISGSYNKNKTGSYKIKYTVTDKAGNTATKTLKVEVIISGDVASGLGIVQTVKTRLGCKYVWGATGPTKFDCSGLTQWVYKKNGISIPRTSSAQRSAGRKISLSQVRAGDIVWRKGHVGIYVGNGQVIHAPGRGKVVCYTTLKGFTCGLRFN
jgi:cell wall-associated NlpC family hydrolase